MCEADILTPALLPPEMELWGGMDEPRGRVDSWTYYLVIKDGILYVTRSDVLCEVSCFIFSHLCSLGCGISGYTDDTHLVYKHYYLKYRYYYI